MPVDTIIKDLLEVVGKDRLLIESAIAELPSGARTVLVLHDIEGFRHDEIACEFRIAEAILKPLSIQQGMPLLTYESDGYPVSPSFLRQVDVHTQQVLEHAAKRESILKCGA